MSDQKIVITKTVPANNSSTPGNDTLKMKVTVSMNADENGSKRPTQGRIVLRSGQHQVEQPPKSPEDKGKRCCCSCM
jgi:hypothetical protein